MITNPFTSDTYTTIWSKHFSPSVSATRFGFLKNLLFEKHKFLPLYFNYGKTHTKGISYTIENSDVEDIDGKVLLIYDVPTFFNTAELSQNRIRGYKIKQYPGFLINLEPYKDFNEFMVGTFKKSSRYKLNKYKRKLESCFDINYKMFHGEISKVEYNSVFDSFNKLLVKRFDDKQVTNNNLEKEEWDFYHDVAYPMILEKKAGLYVIYNGTQPIGVTLVYFSEDIIFDAITVFDIDYSKFNLGSVTIMKLIEWSIEHKLKIFDFSKGYFDYKKRWASEEYNFEYHILYDSKSLLASLIAFALKAYYEIKQILRDKNVNKKLHELTFWIRNDKAKKRSDLTYEFWSIEQETIDEELVKVDFNALENHFLKDIIFDLLYLNNEKLIDVTLHQIAKDKSTYLLKGKSVELKLKIKIS